MSVHQSRKVWFSRAALMFLCWRFVVLIFFPRHHRRSIARWSHGGAEPARLEGNPDSAKMQCPCLCPKVLLSLAAHLVWLVLSLLLYLFPGFCSLPRAALSRWRKAQPLCSPSLQKAALLMRVVVVLPVEETSAVRLPPARMIATPAPQQFFCRRRRCQRQNICGHHSNKESVWTVAAGPPQLTSLGNTSLQTNNLGVLCFPPQNLLCRTRKRV